MDREFNRYKVLPGFFYRSTEKIKEEIRRITREIEEITECVNVRDILMNMLTECAKKEPERWLSELCELIFETEESYKRLGRLDGLLTGLLDEWREIKCAAAQ